MEDVQEEPEIMQSNNRTWIEETPALQTAQPSGKPITTPKLDATRPKKLQVTINPSDRSAADAVLGRNEEPKRKKKRKRPKGT
ncbi:Hypothetical protein FKW44_001448 [Caligus rogercresseyi]|uniref:Uncharacterized protein n=1 Tax=Caligus rogercresseyi TaxID=217165 RepID=A0A7T8KIY5_CALRO|nr:Hypothetical protein FKW44_001448 [Caligus rogercresseyi]